MEQLGYLQQLLTESTSYGFLQTGSTSTTRACAAEPDQRAPDLLLPTSDSIANGGDEAEQELRSREEPLLEQREGRGCCGGRMKSSLGLLLIHTYTLSPPRCVHGPLVHFSCVHVSQTQPRKPCLCVGYHQVGARIYSETFMIKVRQRGGARNHKSANLIPNTTNLSEGFSLAVTLRLRGRGSADYPRIFHTWFGFSEKGAVQTAAAGWDQLKRSLKENSPRAKIVPGLCQPDSQKP